MIIPEREKVVQEIPCCTKRFDGIQQVLQSKKCKTMKRRWKICPRRMKVFFRILYFRCGRDDVVLKNLSINYRAKHWWESLVRRTTRWPRQFLLYPRIIKFNIPKDHSEWIFHKNNLRYPSAGSVMNNGRKPVEAVSNSLGIRRLQLVRLIVFSSTPPGPPSFAFRTHNHSSPQLPSSPNSLSALR